MGIWENRSANIFKDSSFVPFRRSRKNFPFPCSLSYSLWIAVTVSSSSALARALWNLRRKLNLLASELNSLVLPRVKLFQIQVVKSNFPQGDDILQTQLQCGPEFRLTDSLGEVQSVNLLQPDEVVGNLLEVLLRGQQFWWGAAVYEKLNISSRIPSTSGLLEFILDQCLNNMKRSTGWSGENREISNPLPKDRLGSPFWLINVYFISVEILCWAWMLSMFLMSLCRAWKSSLPREKVCVNIRMTRQESLLTATISTQLGWRTDCRNLSIQFNLILIKIVNE